MRVGDELTKALQERILIMDGAMGTMLQRHRLGEAEYRGNEFSHWHLDIKGNNDILNITQPALVEDVYHQYIKAGADIITTNTFNAQRISLADYEMQAYASPINLAAAQLTKRVAQSYDRKVWVAGSVGPMNKTLSLSPDVNDPAYRAMTFDEAMLAYKEQMFALVEGGVDILLIETIFDTLNAKAAIVATKQLFREHPAMQVPVMISGTIVDQAGRTLSGQTPLSFLISVLHASPLSVGLNCALGANLMTPYLKEIAHYAPCFVSAYPNAGLPNEMGEYDESPTSFAEQIKVWLEAGLINVVGGCCGTTPQHIAALKALTQAYKPRMLVLA